MEEFTTNIKNKQSGGMLHELERLLKASQSCNFGIALNEHNLSHEEIEIVQLLNKVMSNYKSGTDYNMMKYRLVNDALNVALWDMDVVGGDPVNPGNKFTWSPEFRRMIGFTDEKDFPDILSSWSDRLHPDEKDAVIACLVAHLNDRTGRTPYDLEYRLKMKTGEYRNFHVFGATMRDKKGIPLRVAGALQDVTEKKLIQEQLETSDKRLQLLLKSIDIALWDMIVDPIDPVGGNNEFWWSDEFRQLLGFSGKHDFPDVLSSWSDRIHPEDKEKTLNAFSEHLNDYTGNTPYNVEFHIQKKMANTYLCRQMVQHCVHQTERLFE